MALDLLTTIELDMQNPYSSSSIVHVNQYDTAGRIKAQLLNGGVKWQVPQGAKPVVMFKKTDNIGGFYDVTELNPSTAAVTVDGSDSSIIYITLDQQTTTTATPTGQYVNMQVAFYQNSARLSTFAFHMQVAESVVTSGDIHSNWLFNILSQEIAQILTDATTPEFISQWLENNITQETGYVIDDSLTIAGAASDAQATGKMVTVSDTNPGVAANKVWVKKTPSEIVVPTEDEVEDLKSALNYELIHQLNMLTNVPTPYNGAIGTISADPNADKTKDYLCQKAGHAHYGDVMYYNGVEWAYDTLYKQRESTYTFFGRDKVIIDIENNRYSLGNDLFIYANESRYVGVISPVTNQSLPLSSISTNGVIIYADLADGLLKCSGINKSSLDYDPDHILCGYIYKTTGYCLFRFPFELKSEVDARTAEAAHNTMMEGGKALSLAAAKKVNLYNNLTKKVSFLFVTDTHMNGLGDTIIRATNNMDMFRYTANLGLFDFAFFCGDFISCYGYTKNQYVTPFVQYEEYLNGFEIPFYIAKGNHDGNVNSTSTQQDVEDNGFTKAQYYYLFQNRMKNCIREVDSANPYGGYYYMDYSNEKVRIIVLNDFEHPLVDDGLYHSAAQCTWFYNALNSLEANWNVLVLSHYITSYKYNVGTIIDAFNNKGITKTAEDTGISYTFDARANGTFIAHIHGHSHTDEYDNNRGWNRIGVQRGYAIESEFDTTNEFCFSIFTINPDNSKLYETRVGRGDSREFNYGSTVGMVT